MAKVEKKSVEDVISSINKKYGQNTLMSLGSNDRAKVKTISSGSMAIDKALGGGWAVGRIAELFAEESAGKSTLCLHAIAEAQKTGGRVAYIDSENAMDVNYAKTLGVDVDNLLFSQPGTAEEALQILVDLIDTGAFRMVVVDSVAALTPAKVIENDVGESTIGILARLMSQELPKIASKALSNECTILMVNQIREKIGGYGGGITTPGGRALKFYASQRVHLFKGSLASDHGEATGNDSWCRVVKNKVAPPFREARYSIKFGTGLDKMRELIDFAVEYGIISKGGSWYSYGDTKLGQGVLNVMALLEDNPELTEEIQIKLKQRLEDEI